MDILQSFTSHSVSGFCRGIVCSWDKKYRLNISSTWTTLLMLRSFTEKEGQALASEMPKKVSTWGELAFPFLISCWSPFLSFFLSKRLKI